MQADKEEKLQKMQADKEEKLEKERRELEIERREFMKKQQEQFQETIKLISGKEPSNEKITAVPIWDKDELLSSYSPKLLLWDSSTKLSLSLIHI